MIVLSFAIPGSHFFGKRCFPKTCNPDSFASRYLSLCENLQFCAKSLSSDVADSENVVAESCRISSNESCALILALSATAFVESRVVNQRLIETTAPVQSAGHN